MSIVDGMMKPGGQGRRFGTTIRGVKSIDQLRMRMEAAKERAELALQAEAVAHDRFTKDPLRDQEWQEARRVAADAVLEFDAAQTAYLEALQSSPPS